MKPLACLLALAAPLTAQDAWSARVAAHRARQRPGAEFCLLIRPDGEAWRGTWASDEGVGELLFTGDLAAVVFQKGEAEEMARRMNWGAQPRWVLLDPHGEVVASGERPPDAASLLEAFRGLSWVSRMGRLSRFLAEHPDQGEARLEALIVAVGMATSTDIRGDRVRADGQVHEPTPEDRYREQRLWQGALAAMTDLRKVDGWLEHPRIQEGLRSMGLGLLPEEGVLTREGPLRAIRQELEQALLRRPSTESLWQAWEWFAGLDAQAQPEALLEAMVMAPGQPPLPLPAAESLRRTAWLRKDWANLEKVAKGALGVAWPPPGGWPRSEMPTRQAYLAAWVPVLAMGLAGQDRLEALTELLDRARPLVGGQWRRLILGVRRATALARIDQKDPVPEVLRAYLSLADPPDPPTAPDPPVLQAVLLGVPGWKGAWDRLRRHEAFDAFSGAELQWGELPAGKQTALRRAREWDDAPRWVVLRGEDVVATGTTLPPAAGLADRIRAERAPALEALRTFVAAHPDHDEARERLQELLRQRMPHPRLEVQLAAQAQRALQPFLPAEGPKPDEPGAWKPLPELWAAPARRALPALEAQLGRWPESLGLWQAWLDWASVHPAAQDPTALFERLAVWKTRARGGPAPLPSDIVLMVARRLKAAGRWEALARWCQAMWEGGIGPQAQAVFGTESPVERAQGGELMRVVHGLMPLYLEALAHTGRGEAAKAFSRQWAFLPPVGR